MANPLAGRIEESLRPIVGTVLASVSVDLEARAIGKTADTITVNDLDALAAAMITQLSKFVGDDLAEAAASKVREMG